LRYKRQVTYAATVAAAASLVLYIALGGARSTASVTSVASRVPLDAQGYVLAPSLPSLLESLSLFFGRSVTLINVPRLSDATSSKSEDLQQQLNRVASAQSYSIAGEDVRLPTSCLNLSAKELQSRAGLHPDTSAAVIIDRERVAPWKERIVLAIAPLKLEQFADTLATMAVRSSYIVRFSIPKSQKKETIRIELPYKQGIQLCDGQQRIVSDRSETEISGDRRSAHLRLEFTGLNPSFDIKCSILGNQLADGCKCELYKVDESGTVLRPKACQSTVIESASDLEKFNEVRSFLLDGKPPTTSVALNFPFIGWQSLSDNLAVSWDSESSTLVIGNKSQIEAGPTYKTGDAASSIIRNDRFIELYKQTLTRSASLMGSIRPDVLKTTAFNRLVSLPVEFFATVGAEEIKLSSSVSFEPLDAGLLQDISREARLQERTRPPLSTSGNATVRIEDEKVGQLVLFADQYALDRLVEEKVALTLDPTATLKTGFARYLFAKMGLSDDLQRGARDTFSPQLQQITIFDDDPREWLPGVVVTIPFDAANVPQAFVCREYQRIRQETEQRILMNSSREAKTKTPFDEKVSTDEYRDRLLKALKVALGDKLASSLVEKYSFDPVSLEVSAPKHGDSQSDQACGASRRIVKIGGKDWPLYSLTPNVNDVMKKYYYRIPQIEQLAVSRRVDMQATMKSIEKEIAPLKEDGVTRRQAITALKSMHEKHKGDVPRPLTAAHRSELRQVNALLGRLKTDNAPETLNTSSEVRDWIETSSVIDSLEAYEAQIEQKQLELRNLRSKSDAESQLFPRMIKDIETNQLQAVATVDAEKRVILIASNVKALRRSLDPAITQKPNVAEEGDALGERVRLFGTADSAARWLLELEKDDDKSSAPKWRQSLVAGRLLPWSKVVIGIGSSNNVLGISMSAGVAEFSR
jgi:hypothetical protein